MNKHQKQPLLSPEKYIRTRARTLPVGSCYINDNWRESGYATILVTRIHINGNVTHGAYMVDLYCLGVKDSFWKFNEHPKDFHEFLDKQHRENDYGIRIRSVDYPLVHNIIYGAIAFAEESGFHPHKTFDLPKYILEEDTDSIKLIDVEFGYKGKPLYISSPENPGEKIRVLPHLEKKLGQGNYYFITEAEADEFFEREEEDENDAIDYHNPVVKKNLILDFISLTSNPKKILRKNPEKIGKILETADSIFFEYMASEEELNRASGAIAELFDFSISREFLSDEILFGQTTPPANSREIRREAERLYQMVNADQWKEGFPEADRMRVQYPEIPVFQYLYLRFLELKTSLKDHLDQLKILTDRNPDYLPFTYMFAMSFILNKPDKTLRRISDELHLKNLYPGRTSFCREEVSLYIQLLSLNYSISGEIIMTEELMSYIMQHHPGLMPEEQILSAKISKIPQVLEWCEKWMKENPE